MISSFLSLGIGSATKTKKRKKKSKKKKGHTSQCIESSRYEKMVQHPSSCDCRCHK